MSLSRILALAFAATVWAVCTVSVAADSLSYRVVNRYPHDPNAFTQGLVYDNGVFYESTGLYGQSTLRAVEPATGTVLRAVKLPDRAFGEGLALVEDKLFQLTWREAVAFVYDRETFQFVGQHKYQSEGWGLAYDGQYLIRSDGSDVLFFHAPDDFSVVKKITVRDGKQAITRLNELEFVDGLIWANVWQQDHIAVIDPGTGQVNAWLDLKNLRPNTQRGSVEDVLNGIAYDPRSGNLFVTGKKWPVLYELEIAAFPKAGESKRPH